jgi:hypothetical protein
MGQNQVRVRPEPDQADVGRSAPHPLLDIEYFRLYNDLAVHCGPPPSPPLALLASFFDLAAIQHVGDDLMMEVAACFLKATLEDESRVEVWYEIWTRVLSYLQSRAKSISTCSPALTDIIGWVCKGTVTALRASGDDRKACA